MQHSDLTADPYPTRLSSLYAVRHTPPYKLSIPPNHDLLDTPPTVTDFTSLIARLLTTLIHILDARIPRPANPNGDPSLDFTPPNEPRGLRICIPLPRDRIRAQAKQTSCMLPKPSRSRMPDSRSSPQPPRQRSHLKSSISTGRCLANLMHVAQTKPITHACLTGPDVHLALPLTSVLYPTAHSPHFHPISTPPFHISTHTINSQLQLHRLHIAALPIHLNTIHHSINHTPSPDLTQPLYSPPFRLYRLELATMASSRVPNHPVTYSSHFEPLADFETQSPLLQSTFDTVRANQYGFVKTSSFIQCGGTTDDKSENFEVELVTNTALTNVLESDFLYAISGKMIATNDGYPPALSYNHEIVTRICATGPNQPDFSNKTFISSLGVITHRQEVVPEAAEMGVSLEVIVAHSDWDAENRGHKKFDVKYIVPGTKNLIKTHSLYVVGRKVKIIGRLIDFDMDINMAVVLVSSFIGLTCADCRRLMIVIHRSTTTKFSPKSVDENTGGARQPSPSGSRPSPITQSLPQRKSAPAAKFSANVTPTKGKQKAQEASDDEEEAMFDKDKAEASEPEPASAAPQASKRGRPRKLILQEAAKRMKKF
ncbi:hypothetical protein PTTG_09988 [Puccinia triticina 1-1 BBBD Race 1]|uniref:Uncharacterized protein n=1 Tax=Puccinia triticina (isolate 1-1 / race 1 (BBBD)) TaxID=630390 RepID=A0A0C4F9V3_PUCT1|nr:hypothetical protein PTTG_09988 [Puccinia triticina 1-1 BBBD Race 1]